MLLFLLDIVARKDNFPQKTNIQAIKRVETPLTEKPFSCLWCDSSEFLSRLSLSLHTVKRHRDKMNDFSIQKGDLEGSKFIELTPEGKVKGPEINPDLHNTTLTSDIKSVLNVLDRWVGNKGIYRLI